MTWAFKMFNVQGVLLYTWSDSMTTPPQDPGVVVPSLHLTLKDIADIE